MTRAARFGLRWGGFVEHAGRVNRAETWRSTRDAVVGVLGAMWVLFLLQHLTAWFSPWGGLTRFGVRPRVWDSVVTGPLLMPFLHGGWGHLIGNTVALLSLLPFFFLVHERPLTAWSRFAILWLGSGLLLWLIGPPNSLNIGASGLVYALTAYLVVFGLRGGHWLAAIVAVAVLLFQAGTLVSGLLPREPGISYAGHWSGLLVGAGLAAMLPIRQAGRG